MSGDDNFFAMPPADEAPVPPAEGEPSGDGGFTMIGEAPPMEAPMLGDVNEAPPADLGFAAAPMDAFAALPVEYEAPMDAFAAPPTEYEAPMDAFAAPPAEDAPIILAPPAEEVMGVVETGEDEEEEEEIPAEPLEPSPMQKWNEEWQVTLGNRKDEENSTKGEMVEASRLFMENFSKERENKREGKMSTNREDEQAKLEAIEADLENDNSWQRACKMVELSHDAAEDGEDVKRMRDVMILLKNEPTRAAAVGA